MNFLYTINDQFVPQAAAGMCSIFENNKDAESITVYIFALGITDTNARLLHKLAADYAREVCIIPLGELSDYFPFAFDTKGWNPIILARLLLDRLLPPTVNRIIYLDGDTIVRDNLTDLWETDMGGAAVGGCIEPTVNRRQLDYLHMEGIPYINSGVMLVDLKKWREDGLGERVIRFLGENAAILIASDQDAINGTLKGKIFYLPPRYNFYNIYEVYPYQTLSRLVPSGKYYAKELVDQAKVNPAIVHYLGEERPWREGNRHTYREDFERYLSMTPWADTPPERGWRAYFRAFYLFNAMTKPFPMMRYNTMTVLIPLFLKYRTTQLKKEKQ